MTTPHEESPNTEEDLLAAAEAATPASETESSEPEAPSTAPAYTEEDLLAAAEPGIDDDPISPEPASSRDERANPTHC